MRLKPRIVAGVLAVTMAASLLQYPSVSVRAEEVVSQGAEDATVKDDGIANEAGNKTTPSITQNQEQEEVQEPVNESDADVSIDDSENNDSTKNQESGTEDGSISSDGENAGDNTTEDEDGEEVNPEDGSNDNTEQDKTNEATDGSEVEDDENIPDETKTGEEIPDKLDEELLQDTMLDVDEEAVNNEISAMSLETSGTCGDNLTWELIDGTLTISGTGEMSLYGGELESGYDVAPWYGQRETIENTKSERIT